MGILETSSSGTEFSVSVLTLHEVLWWPDMGCLRGQSQGTTVRAVHWLLGRGGASWSKEIFYETAKKKNVPVGLLFHICLPLALWGQYTNSCGVRVGINSCFMRRACVFALTLERSHHNHPGATVEAQTQTVKEKGHISVLCPGLSHSCSFGWAIQPVTKAEEHQQGSCSIFSSAFLFCWLGLTWLACQLIAQKIHLHMQN